MQTRAEKIDILGEQSDAGSDLSPRATAAKLLDWGVAKERLPIDRVLVLGMLAGFFIALGGALFTAVMTGADLGYGPARLIGGMTFSMGLLLVCASGAELSTGNCMCLAAWAEARMSTEGVARVLGVSFAANLVGALLLLGLMAGTGLLSGSHGATAAAIAKSKLALAPLATFTRAVLCNMLVCFAVWLILSARTLTSKFAGLVLPISAFVVLGFEHSIANVYLLPAGLLAGAEGTVRDVVRNLILVTVGNAVGGAIVAFIYWAGYVRPVLVVEPNGRTA